ncbi:MAG: hypothetical protein IIB58_03230 [Planctomycetes bacterium]|nr:hypothetical protein [Planctomycetota bacterium]
MSTTDHHNTIPAGPHWQAAADYGIDMNQLECLLALTPSERLERHEQARQLVFALRRAGTKLYGYDPRHPPENPTR